MSANSRLLFFFPCPDLIFVTLISQFSLEKWISKIKIFYLFSHKKKRLNRHHHTLVFFCSLVSSNFTAIGLSSYLESWANLTLSPREFLLDRTTFTSRHVVINGLVISMAIALKLLKWVLYCHRLRCILQGSSS